MSRTAPFAGAGERSQHRLEDRPDVVGDDARALGRRMDAVALVQRSATRRLRAETAPAARRIASRARDRPRETRRRSRGPKFGGASMPASTTLTPRSWRPLDDRATGCVAAASTGRPRSPSLPPSATTSTRTSPSSAQSSRRQAAGRRVAGHAGVDDLIAAARRRRRRCCKQRRIRLARAPDRGRP